MRERELGARMIEGISEQIVPLAEHFSRDLSVAVTERQTCAWARPGP